MNSDEIQNTSTGQRQRTAFWRLSSGKNGEKYLIFPKTRPKNETLISNSDSQELENPTQIRTYKMRWFILFVICFVNISNAINWIQYSSIADFTGKFYDINYIKVNFLSLVYLIASIPTGLVSFIIIDYFGIRSSINIAGWLNFIGTVIRALSSVDEADGEPLVAVSSKYAVVMTGQAFCSFAQPFIMFVTTKFANAWFKEDQRALANTVALGSNTFGVLIGAFFSPLIVKSDETYRKEMSTLNFVTCAVALVPAVLATFITRSVPPTPPSYSALVNLNPSANSYDYDLLGNSAGGSTEGAQSQLTFSENFKVYISQVSKLFKSVHFIILFMSFGLALGLFNALTTLIEQMLCVRGYSDDDVGIFGGLMIISGLVGSLIAGIILDKTKRFEEMAKICFSFAAIANIFFAILQIYNNDLSTYKYLMYLAFALIGIFGLPLLPICMEMSVECVYPIPEETSTGLLFIAGQIFGVVMILSYPSLAAKVPETSVTFQTVQTCTTANSTSQTSLDVLDFANPIYGQTIFMCAIALFFTVFYKCPYLRLRAEREKLAEKILNSSSRQVDFS